jgi:hypothetical protein
MKTCKVTYGLFADASRFQWAAMVGSFVTHDHFPEIETELGREHVLPRRVDFTK